MEKVRRFRVPKEEVWFVQSVLTECEGEAVVTLGRREGAASIISVLFDSTAEAHVVRMFAYLESIGKMKSCS